jgi:hypothetical protein
MAENVFAPVGNTTLLSGTTSSSRVALPLMGTYGGGNYRVYNDGPDKIFIAQGDATVVAVIPTAGNPANGMAVGIGATEVFNLASGNSLAGICPNSTASLYITGGQGQ